MSLAEALTIASEDRPLPLRKRPDLQITESRFQQVRSWMVKDPVSLKYHRLQDPEVTVLNMLDGKTSLRDIQEKLQQRYPTKITRLSDLQYLLSTFHRSGLVLAEASGQGTQMLRRRRQTVQQKWMQRLSNILAIRLPGFDPDRILTWLHPRIGWIFEPWAVWCWLLLAGAAGILLLVNIEEFRGKLPAFYQFFQLGNFVWLALVMAVTKIVHEFGHGLSCKHFGGECHEIGILFLVFTPAMYCDTSDSWTLPNKWHRIFIGAAGMYVEVAMASIATFVWWYTQPGLVHFMALNVMFVSSVSTIVFNANPLLRYDGYYILADLLEIPNLAQKSRLALLNLLRVICLGMEPVSRRSLPPRGWAWFALYSIASFFYRWFVLGLILWFLYSVFRPYGLEVIGHGMILFSLVGMIVMPLWKTGQFFAVPGRLDQVKWPRFAVTCCVLAAILAGIFYIPIPSHVRGTLVVRPDDGERIYVTQGGTIREVAAAYGTAVSSEDVIVQLENADLDLRIAELEGELASREGTLRDLRRRSNHPTAAAQIPQAEAAVESTTRILKQLQEDADRLTLRAPRTGVVMPPAEVIPPAMPSAADLPGWQGRALDPENIGALLEVDTLVATVGDPTAMKAVLFVDQSDIELVSVDQPVEIMLDEAPGRILKSSIREIAKIDLKIPPREVTPTAGGKLPTKQGPDGREQPMFVYYEATVPLRNSPVPLLSGFRGEAKVDVGSLSIGDRLLRALRKVVHFR
jgi:putative peptide zinc metalloprotease protein